MGKFRILGFVLLLGSSKLWASPIVVGVATGSAVKVAAVQTAFQQVFPDREIIVRSFKAKSNVAEQPVGQSWGRQGAINRLRSARELALLNKLEGPFDYWVSMENFIEGVAGETTWQDVAAVVLTASSQMVTSYSRPTYFPGAFADAARAHSILAEESGYSVTVGAIIREVYQRRGVDLLSDNWHQHADFGGVSRGDILAETLGVALENLRCIYLLK